MILINLLPHREARRKQRRLAFFAGLGVAAVAGVLIAGAGFVVIDQMKAAQLRRDDYLAAEIKRLEGQIKDIASLRAEIDGLKARQQAVEDLQINRNMPVHLLDELARQTPEGIYLTSVKQTDGSVLIVGMAQTNERVSEFLRNCANRSQWIDRPELVEIKAVALPAAAGSREVRRLFEFSMRVAMRMPAAAAASAPAAAPAVKRVD